MNATNNLTEPSSTGPSTPAELNQLLQGMGGTNPHDLLGAGVQVSLAGAMAQATVVALLFLAVFTFGPHLWSTPIGAKGSAPDAARTATPDTSKTAPALPVAPDKGKVTVESPKQPPVSKDALEKLGVTETKKVDPKVNPLDKAADDLFKELEKK